MTMNHRMSKRILFAIVAILGVPAAAAAQGDGPRLYWKTLAGSSAVTFWGINASGNTNPLDPAQVVEPTASFSADMAMLGYHRTLDLFDRSATASVLMPVGNLQGEVAGTSFSQQASASGFGDLTLQLNTNIVGAPAINDLPSLLRYEPTFTLDLLTSLALPVGEYDSDEALNIGQNRWYGRIGAPMMLTFGPWVPGERTTLEVLPAVWLFDDNDDYQGGKTLSTDPIFAIEGHLTRDFTESAWGSLDVAWFSGGESQVAGVSGESIDNLGVGLTFGFQVNDNLSITMSYFSTIDDGDAGDVRGDEFRLMFSYGWNDLLEGMRRLSGE
jgi:hypothetical protein